MDVDKSTGEILPVPGNPDMERDEPSLIAEWADIKEYIQRFSPRLKDIETELEKRMRERGAEALSSERVEGTLKGGKSIDRAKLAPILTLEGIPEDKLALAYKPPSMQPVGAQWDLQQVKALAKFNEKVKLILKDAESPTPPVFSLKLKSKPVVVKGGPGFEKPFNKWVETWTAVGIRTIGGGGPPRRCGKDAGGVECVLDLNHDGACLPF